MITVNENFGYIKAENPKMKDFIEPTKKYAEEVKDISDKIRQETENMMKDLKVFNDAFNEVKEKHGQGMSMKQIGDSYKRAKEQQEIKGIEEDILDIFSKKLKSLKQNLQIDDGGDYL